MPPQECEIILVRHGQTEFNVQQRLQGQLIPGPGLDALGQQQAAALAARLAREQFECVYTSDSQRAAQTAEAIGGATGHVPVAMPQLRERHLGHLQGLTYAEAEVQQPEAYAALMSNSADVRIPGGGESVAELQARARAALEGIALRHPSGRVLVVSHGGFLDAAYRLATGQPAAPGMSGGGANINGALNVLRIGPGGGGGCCGGSGGCSDGACCSGSRGTGSNCCEAGCGSCNSSGRSAVWEVVGWGIADHLEEVGFMEAAFGGGGASG